MEPDVPTEINNKTDNSVTTLKSREKGILEKYPTDCDGQPVQNKENTCSTTHEKQQTVDKQQQSEMPAEQQQSEMPGQQQHSKMPTQQQSEMHAQQQPSEMPEQQQQSEMPAQTQQQSKMPSQQQTDMSTQQQQQQFEMPDQQQSEMPTQQQQSEMSDQPQQQSKMPSQQQNDMPTQQQQFEMPDQQQSEMPTQRQQSEMPDQPQQQSKMPSQQQNDMPTQQQQQHSEMPDQQQSEMPTQQQQSEIPDQQQSEMPMQPQQQSKIPDQQQKQQSDSPTQQQQQSEMAVNHQSEMAVNHQSEMVAQQQSEIPAQQQQQSEMVDNQHQSEVGTCQYQTEVPHPQTLEGSSRERSSQPDENKIASCCADNHGDSLAPYLPPPSDTYTSSQRRIHDGCSNVLHGLNMPDSMLQGRDEDSIVAAQLMTSLARGNLAFDSHQQMSPQTSSACNLIVNSNQILNHSAVSQSLEPLEPNSDSYIPNVRYRAPNCDSVYQTLNSVYNSDQTTAGSHIMNSSMASSGFIPMDSYSEGSTGQWLQGEHRQRNGYPGMDIPGYGQHAHNMSTSIHHFEQNSQTDSWNGPPTGFDNRSHVLPNPIRAHSNYGCAMQNLHGLPPEQVCFNDQMVAMGGMGDRSNNHSRNSYNDSGIAQLQDLSCNTPIAFDIGQSNHMVDYTVQKPPSLPPISEITPIANESSDSSNLPETTASVYQSYPNNESLRKRSYEGDLEDIERFPDMGQKRRKKSRSSRSRSGGVGYVDLMKNLFYTPPTQNLGVKPQENFEYNLPEVDNRTDNSMNREGFYMIVSPEINPSEVDTIDHKGLIAKYIDYLLIENEQITEMSKSVSIPIENCVMDDPYLMDIIKVKIPFPTPKYLHWLRTYYPNICVDWGAINKELSQYLPAGNVRKRRTYYIDNRPSPLLLGESFYFFQREKDRLSSR